MDLLEETAEDGCKPSDNELPKNIFNLIISNETESHTTSERDDVISHDELPEDIKDNGDEGGQAMVLGEAEENDGFNLMTMPDLLTPGDVNKENVSSSNSNTSSHKFIEADLSNEDDKLLSSKTIQTKALAILWAEAIKAQNEGHYKEAIRNFTAIYEVSSNEMKLFS